MRKIHLYNTLSGKKEELVTQEPNHIKMYACGVTVYDHCHIGHAMQAIYFDVIRRYLEFAGYKVTYVRNYTDVDDKIINKAKERGITPKQLTEEIISSSERDMKELGVSRADYEPKVSDCIPDIIDMISQLIEKNFAYSTSAGDVYYRVKNKSDYGKLSNRDPSQLRSGTRELAHGEKEDELDFALWKSDDTPGASWQSPWGWGRPGWHIECSAMSKHFLGKSFDIHGGGRDLVFPHHENEIAQSEAANDCLYASYWIHSGLLTIEKQKMSKSLGNHILISDFLSRYPAEVLRLAYLQNHYSSNVDFSEDVFKNCLKKLLYFYETMASLYEISSGANAVEGAELVEGYDPGQLETAFHASMSNDFSTVGALRDLHLAMKKANELKKLKKSAKKSATAAAYVKTLRTLFGVLGLLREEPENFTLHLKLRLLPELGLKEAEIIQAIQERIDARSQKDFAKADQIRQQLSAKGIELMDTPQGTNWTVRT